jgi:copper chaperone CopZ
MKFATILLCLAGLVFGYIAIQGDDQTVEAWEHPTTDRLTGPIPEGHQVLRFQVDGMCCDSCPNKLRTWLAGVEGVVDSAVSFEDSQAEAMVPDGYDPAPVLAALNQDKYSAQVAP